MSIITMLNMKGGVGKTSSVINIAANLKNSGYKVLLIDLDAQANLTQGLGISDELEKNTYTMIRKDDSVEGSIVNVDGLDLIPGTIDLAVADMELSTKIARELILQGILENIKKRYDFIFLDCPPNLGIMTVNAIATSDYYLIPLQAEYFALRGLKKLIDNVKFVKEETRTKIELLGVFLTRFNKQKTLSRDVHEIAIENLGKAVFDTYIRENIAVSESQSQGIDIYKYDKASNAAIDYINLTKEIVSRIK